MSTTASSRTTWAPYAFISPFYILSALFLVVPIGAAVYLSLTAWAGIGTPEFVGLGNYRKLFRDETFYASLTNTVIYVLVSVLVVVPLALLVAQALNTRGLRVRDLWRVTYFLPVVLSPIVIALVFGLLFDRQFGLVNSVLRAILGTGGIDWLGDPTWAKVSVSILIVWRWTGYLSIFFLAGLQAIPRELYEAAVIDGAGRLRMFANVTLPMLRPVTVFVALTSLIGAAQIFDEPFLLTSGGPGTATLSTAMFVYRSAFQRQQLGYACAAAVVLFAIIFLIGRVATAVSGLGRER